MSRERMNMDNWGWIIPNHYHPRHVSIWTLILSMKTKSSMIIRRQQHPTLKYDKSRLVPTLLRTSWNHHHCPPPLPPLLLIRTTQIQDMIYIRVVLVVVPCRVSDVWDTVRLILRHNRNWSKVYTKIISMSHKSWPVMHIVPFWPRNTKY